VTTVGALAPAELKARLAGPGLYLRTGPFINCVRSNLALIADGIGKLYADYPLAPEQGAAAFADFHVHFPGSPGLRRLWRPQVHFDHDGVHPFAPSPLEQAYPMFEWVLNWCVSSRAHDYLMIHAAVVERNGCAVILPAPPGSGKSTLCAALVHRGWRLLSDELTLVRLSDGLLVPLPRPISLKNASIDIIGAYVDQPVFTRAVDTAHKGHVAHLKPPADSVARAAETARPAWVIFPQYAAGEGASLSPMAPARAFMQLAENAFNYSLLGAAGFAALGDVIGQSDCYRFRYSVLDEAVDVFARLAPPAR
jgi:HprK-related kinase A